MSSIYINQPIPLETYFTSGGQPLDLSTALDIRYDFWRPNNDTNAPSGNVSGTITGPATDGYVEGEIPASENNIAGQKFRVQAVVIFSNGEFPAGTINFSVKQRGT